MRRLAAAAAILALASCKSSRRQRVEVVEDDKGEISERVEMGDAAHAIQLVQGFHEIEQGGWRWTKGKFAVTLKTPAGAAKSGGRLEITYTMPEVVISRAGAPALSCTVNGYALEPEETKAGKFVYARDVPAAALTQEGASFECGVSKFLAANQVEERELGLIAHSAVLKAK